MIHLSLLVCSVHLFYLVTHKKKKRVGSIYHLISLAF